MRNILLITLILISFSGCKEELDCCVQPPESQDFRQDMRNFVQGISAYSKGINPNFSIIPQNGQTLVVNDEDDISSVNQNYIDAIDGMGQEDFFYGYDNDDQATSSSDNSFIAQYLDKAKEGDIQILVTDYCSTLSKMEDSYVQNGSKGYISFAADHRELDNIPGFPSIPNNENSSDITELSEIKNFLYMISPSAYDTKAAFLEAVKATNYDLVLIDYFFNDEEEYSTAEIASLKVKANGGKRLVISYMSIGEAEDYRYYWNTDWKDNPPSWMSTVNPDWPGNFKVKYWEKEWQDIIFGNNDSYLKKIVDAGFDGVYLDIIDAYEFFE